MRQPVLLVLCLGSAVALAGCGGTTDAEAARALQSVDVIDASNLSDIMLTVADPGEAAAYFTKAATENPDRIDLQRGLAKSLVRDKRPAESVVVWTRIVNSPEGTNDDRVAFADALIRANEWDRAEVELDKIPPTFETYERYRIEALIADSNQEWKKADSFYETAIDLTTTPGSVLNNWGYSKLSRGDYASAEKLFTEAITYDSAGFTAKNNLVLARSAQRKYDMPVVPMTQTERAQLLYTAALSAIKQGDVTIGKGLLQEAVDTSPVFFEAAQRSLDAMDGNVTSG